MTLDLSTDSLIRAGSGLVYIAVGLLVVARSRSRAAWALSSFCALWGLGFVVINPLLADPALIPYGLGIEGVLFLGATAALIVLHLQAPWRAQLSRRQEAVAIALAVTLTLALEATTAAPSYLAVAQYGKYAWPLPAQTLNLAANVVVGAGSLVALSAAFATRRDSPIARGRALLAVGTLGYFAAAYNPVAIDNFPLGVIRLLPLYALLLAVVVAWTPKSRVAPWSLLGLALTGGLVTTFWPNFAGAIGIARMFCALGLAYAVLRGDLLETGTSGLRLRGGVLATTALASLFIVAQVAQNFLAAQYGLLMGGVVAGTLVFAANPIQRAMEQQGSGPLRRTARKDRDAENERVYQLTLSKYLADGVLSPEEELALAHLVDQLGLTARRALELRQEAAGKGAR